MEGVVRSSIWGAFFCDLRSGMPGVGVPFGWLAFFGALTSGMPGVGVGPGGSGDVEMPCGKGLEFVLADEFVLELLAVWQPDKRITTARADG